MDFKTICRTCLKQSDQLTAISSLNMLRIIIDCLRITLDEDTRLPNSVCNFCIDMVNKLASFKLQIENSENLLKQILKNNIKEETITPDKDMISDIKVEQITESERVFIKPIVNFTNFDSKQIENSENVLKQIWKNNIKEEITLDKGIKSDIKIEPIIEDETISRNSTVDFTNCDSKQTIHQLDKVNIFKKCKQLKKIREKTCAICNKTFQSAFKLRRHKIVHEQVRQLHYCRFCKNSYSSVDTLQQHIKRIHGEKPRAKTKCNTCGNSVYYIKIHMKQKHTSPNQLPFPCDLCTKAFLFKSMLTRHKNQFHDVGNTVKFDHLCSTCGKCFKSTGELKTHSEVHSTERKYECGQCKKRYKTRSSLWLHERVHADIRPFSCTYCSKKFATKIILKNHIRTHTGEKPFKCDLCPNAFSVSSTLGTHKKLVHGKCK